MTVDCITWSQTQSCHLWLDWLVQTGTTYILQTRMTRRMDHSGWKDRQCIPEDNYRWRWFHSGPRTEPRGHMGWASMGTVRWPGDWPGPGPGPRLSPVTVTENLNENDNMEWLDLVDYKEEPNYEDDRNSPEKESERKRKHNQSMLIEIFNKVL